MSQRIKGAAEPALAGAAATKMPHWGKTWGGINNAQAAREQARRRIAEIVAYLRSIHQ